MNPLQAWNLRARAHKCSVTGQPFAPGDTFHTAIFLHPETKDWERRDYSAAAWEEQAPLLHPHSHWRGAYHPPVSDAKEKTSLVKIGPEDLLRHLLEEDLPATEEARYVLCLMLERKKILRHQHTEHRDGGPILIYEHARSGEVFLIRDPGIHMEDIGRVGEEVALRLSQAEDVLRAGQEAMEETEPPPSTKLAQV